MAIDANAPSIGLSLFSGLFCARSSFLKDISCCGNCNIQLLTGQLWVVMPVQVQLALVDSELLFSASLKVVNLEQVFVAPVYACCRRIQQSNKPLGVFWQPVEIMLLVLGWSIPELRNPTSWPWSFPVESKQSPGWLLPVWGLPAKFDLVPVWQESTDMRMQSVMKKHLPNTILEKWVELEFLLIQVWN